MKTPDGVFIQSKDHRETFAFRLRLKSGFFLLVFQESGLSRWLGDQMTPLHSIPPWAIAIILCLLVATFTECASNVATATLFLPILASMVPKTQPAQTIFVICRCSYRCFIS